MNEIGARWRLWIDFDTNKVRDHMAWFSTSWKKAAGSNNVFRPDSEICRDVNVFGFWRPTSSFHFSRADNSSALWLNCFHGNPQLRIIGRNGQILYQQQQQDIFVTCQKLPYFVIKIPLWTENLLLLESGLCYWMQWFQHYFPKYSWATRSLSTFFQHNFILLPSKQNKRNGLLFSTPGQE